MNSRERVYAAINHIEPDRVPICFAGTVGSGIEECPPDHCSTTNLYRFLKFDKAQPVIIEPLCNVVAKIDEQCLVRLHSDMRLISDIPPLPQIIDQEHKIWPFCYGGRIKKYGVYDMIDFSNSPMSYMETEKDIEEYPYWPGLDEDIIKGRDLEAKRLKEETPYFIVGSLSCCRFPLNGYFLLSGFEKWLLDLKINPGFYIKLCDKFMEVTLNYIEKFYGALGKYLDAAMLFDDLGTTAAPFISLNDYRKLYKPYQVEIIKAIRKYIPKNSKIILKSNGSIFHFVPDFIEMGIDVISPVQPLANYMEPWRLKKEFGKDITFLGGLDIQYLLPYGTVNEIKKGVRILINEYAKNGGYIFGPSFVIPHVTPPENIVAMFDAVYEFGKYPIDEAENEVNFVSYVKSLNYKMNNQINII